MDMKYIMVVFNGCLEAPILFPDLMVHNIEANHITNTYSGNFNIEIKSAGFCRVGLNGEVTCWGRSASFNKDSRPNEDAKIIKKRLAGLPWGI